MTVETFHIYDKSNTTTPMSGEYLSPDQKLKHEIKEAKEKTSAEKIDWIEHQREIITPEQLGGALNENALEEQASILLKNPNPGLLNTYITREAIPAMQNKQRKTLPHDVFECFRLAIQLNTGNKHPTDEEVEGYIYALLDTSDTQHAHDRKKIQTKPTFRPAA